MILRFQEVCDERTFSGRGDDVDEVGKVEHKSAPLKSLEPSSPAPSQSFLWPRLALRPLSVSSKSPLLEV